ncbi:hypothetical protein VOLCADRAFT_98228 [Volvox carteri f. nagariensis]|uniref:Uncharacterized protein n=1 Tax=Volvox carteri f. nagariensis TaxID=3068 RepID=D8UES6_VOLCA|nr:uncharacterized protein VOLCADRAFT_98228 [Volvox carteri f. nagariensis]EFJ41782.1 hypothetical protein VOLCADRAFT_98228 [Volvox carteri f. nagariensis]|eukprot:XP_002957128.1 hypothetical protein VOLCADRAFT_98228 [Volvox carteri f. nagariensis]
MVVRHVCFQTSGAVYSTPYSLSAASCYKIIHSYIDGGCYKKAAEWTDPLQLQISIEVTHQLALEPRVGLTAADHCFNNIIGMRIPKGEKAEALVWKQKDWALWMAHVPLHFFKDHRRSAQCVQEKSFLVVMKLPASIELGTPPDDMPAPKWPAPGAVPARRPNLDPAPAPANLATHRKQPACPTLAPEGRNHALATTNTAFMDNAVTDLLCGIKVADD